MNSLTGLGSELEAAGHRFMNDEEVTAWIEELRTDDDRIDEVYRQVSEENAIAMGTNAMMIYWDSVITIYLLDHAGGFQSRARTRLTAQEKAGDVIAVSDLCRLECRLKPIRDGDAGSLAQFDAFFFRPDVQRMPITTAFMIGQLSWRATSQLQAGGIRSTWLPPLKQVAIAS